MEKIVFILTFPTDEEPSALKLLKKINFQIKEGEYANYFVLSNTAILKTLETDNDPVKRIRNRQYFNITINSLE